MKTIKILFMYLALIPLLVVVSCKDDDDVTPLDDFTVMTDYMVENNLDVGNVISNWIVGAPTSLDDLPAFLADNYIIDIRSADAFAAGHIEGAVNVPFGDILTGAASADKPIVIACYTGQSAGHAVMALRLSGYPDARVLKFGMSGWNSDLMAPWNGNTGSIAVGHTSWSTDPVETNTEFGSPQFEANGTTGAEILAARVQFMLENGFQGVSGADVLANPANYFINNYWAASDVEDYGHIAGAYRIQPLTIANGEFNFLDPDAEVVSYCWTGQTSSMLTAYLTVLGYNAKSLKFGVNGMIYSELQGHKYAPPSVDLPVVTD